MQIFDPLGLIAPIVVSAKIFLQDLWKLKLSWDESLPQNITSRWMEFRNKLSILHELKVDRHVMLDNAVSIHLHAFADGSEKAYGASLYIRLIDRSGTVKVALLCAKSRVAPTKTISLPRIELCAAQLTAQLVHKVVQVWQHPINEIFYWTDSTITLAWISAPAYTWKTFVSNRVANIQELADPSRWFHVKTDENPADLASRGVMPQKLMQPSLWFDGPNFLSNEFELQSNPPSTSTDPPERKTQKTAMISAAKGSQDLIEELSCRNSYLKTLRVIARCNQFYINVKSRVKKLSCQSLTVLGVDELELAVIACVKCIQRTHFAKEFEALSKDKPIDKRSNIVTLNSFIDDNGVMRVGGRLENADLPFSAKHPILLPKNHSFTVAMANHYHTKNCHAGPQALLSIIRQKFWPLNG